MAQTRTVPDGQLLAYISRTSRRNTRNKRDYDRYYESALRLVRLGGLIVLDDMFQRGEVSDPCNGDARTIWVRALNAKIAADGRADHVMLPIADGMTLTRRRI